MTILKIPAVIDISHWNTIPVWAKVDPRVCGVIMKATQGKYYVDPTFKYNWDGARATKRPVSAYHFFDPNDVPTQAENFLTTCEDIGAIISGKWMGEIPPVLDAEYQNPITDIGTRGVDDIFSQNIMRESAMKDILLAEEVLIKNKKIYARETNTRGGVLALAELSLSPSQLSSQYKLFLDILEAELGLKPIIYTSSWQWSATGNPAWAKEYLLWTAQYPYNPDGQDTPKYFPYGGWTEYWMWQYAESLTMDGISGEVDANVFNGTQEEWNNLYGGEVTIPEPPIGGTMLVATNPNALSLRTQPIVSQATFIELMPANTHIEGTEIVTAADGGKWLKTTLPKVGYCASWLLTYQTPPVASDVVVTVQANDLQKYTETFPAGTKVKIEVS